MDPISAGLSVVGLGLQLFGGSQSAADAKKAAQINQGIAQDEQQINQQKNAQMQLEAQRSNLQQFRNIQRLRSQATASAVSQGANFGSGLQGGLAEVTNEGLYNVQGTNQAVQFGNTIFGINNDISSKKQQLSQVQSDMATDQAWSSLGGALVKNAGTIGGLSKDISAGFGKLSGFAGPYI